MGNVKKSTPRKAKRQGQQSTLIVVDATTGESREDLQVVNGVRVKWREPHITLFQRAIVEIGKLHLPREQREVLDYLMGYCDWGNWLYVQHTAIGAEMGIARPSVSRAMRCLLARGIIEQGESVGKSRCYRLSPNLAWKGTARSWNGAQWERRKQRRTHEALEGRV